MIYHEPILLYKNALRMVKITTEFDYIQQILKRKLQELNEFELNTSTNEDRSNLIFIFSKRAIRPLLTFLRERFQKMNASSNFIDSVSIIFKSWD